MLDKLLPGQYSQLTGKNRQIALLYANVFLFIFSALIILFSIKMLQDRNEVNQTRALRMSQTGIAADLTPPRPFLRSTYWDDVKIGVYLNDIYLVHLEGRSQPRSWR